MMLTIGMPHYNDFDGVFFTLQALRMYHDIEDTEILVVDNSGSDRLKKWLPYWAGSKARYIKDIDCEGTAYAKEKVFEHAKGDFVLCIDCHILFMKDSISKLKNFIRSNPDSKGLFFGCLVYDDLKSFVPSMKDQWRGQMWGIWGKTFNEKDLLDEPMEIWGHGGGCFGSFKKHWLGFHPDFKGFGGEEGYLAEKYRQNGRKVFCLPFLRWNHKFGTGTGYSLNLKDRIHNYLIGHQELDIDESRMIEHFGEAAVNKERKKIVCCCPTYGRYDCLNETVQSFLNQDYLGEKHLVIFNDDPRVKYNFDNPMVDIVNLTERFESLGDKFNGLLSYAIEKYKNAFYMLWPQDDIMLPWALTEISRSYEQTHCGCCYPVGRWFSMKGKIDKFEPTAISHLPLFSQDFYNSIGQFNNISVGEDTNFFGRAKKYTSNKCVGKQLGKERAYHIYRWGNGNYHVSGFNKLIAWLKCKEEVEKTMTPGKYEIIPAWGHDYVSMVRRKHGNC